MTNFNQYDETRSFLLVIPIGQSESLPYRTGEDGFRGQMTITFIAPDILPETVKLQICGPLEHYVNQQSNGQDITFNPGAATTVMIQTANGIKLKATGGVQANRIFEIIWNVTSPRG